MSALQQMIQVTPTAVAQFRTALASEGLDEHAIRILAEKNAGGRIIYGLDFTVTAERTRDDAEIIVDGVRFFVDSDVGQLIAGTVLDYVQRENGSAGFKFDHPAVFLGWSDPIAGRLQELFDQNVNPAIAAHGGRVELIRLESDTAFVKMHGGCQGCGMAAVTLRDGIEKQVLEAIPEIRAVVDTTDHDLGANPYY